MDPGHAGYAHKSIGEARSARGEAGARIASEGVTGERYQRADVAALGMADQNHRLPVASVPARPLPGKTHAAGHVVDGLREPLADRPHPPVVDVEHDHAPTGKRTRQRRHVPGRAWTPVNGHHGGPVATVGRVVDVSHVDAAGQRARSTPGGA